MDPRVFKLSVVYKTAQRATEIAISHLAVGLAEVESAYQSDGSLAMELRQAELGPVGRTILSRLSDTHSQLTVTSAPDISEPQPTEEEKASIHTIPAGHDRTRAWAELAQRLRSEHQELLRRRNGQLDTWLRSYLALLIANINWPAKHEWRWSCDDPTQLVKTLQDLLNVRILTRTEDDLLVGGAVAANFESPQRYDISLELVPASQFLAGWIEFATSNRPGIPFVVDGTLLDLPAGIREMMLELFMEIQQALPSPELGRHPTSPGVVHARGRCQDYEKLVSVLQMYLSQYLPDDPHLPLYDGKVVPLYGGWPYQYVIYANWRGVGSLPIGHLEVAPAGDKLYRFELLHYEANMLEIEDEAPAVAFFGALAAQLEHDYAEFQQGIGKPSQPEKPTGQVELDRWFNYYHQMLAAGIKYTLRNLADDVHLNYDYVRQKHAEYKAENKT